MRPLVLLALVLAACAPSDPAAADVPSPAEAPTAAVPDSSATQLIGADGAMPFRARVPDGVTFEHSASDEGESTTFRTGTRNTLALFVPAPDAGFDDPRAFADLLAGDSGLVVSSSPSGPFRWQAEGRRYILTAGERAGRRFYLTQSVSITDTGYEAALIRSIKDTWTWHPGGEPLR